MEGNRAAHIKELSEARETIQRQIDVLINSEPFCGLDHNVQIGDVLKRLRDTLRELEECISAESGDTAN